MAMFNDSWIYYRYDSLSRLKERDLGNVLTEHQTYLAGSGDCTTTTLPETYYTSAKGSTTKLQGSSTPMIILATSPKLQTR